MFFGITPLSPRPTEPIMHIDIIFARSLINRNQSVLNVTFWSPKYNRTYKRPSFSTRKSHTCELKIPHNSHPYCLQSSISQPQTAAFSPPRTWESFHKRPLISILRRFINQTQPKICIHICAMIFSVSALL